MYCRENTPPGKMLAENKYVSAFAKVPGGWPALSPARAALKVGAMSVSGSATALASSIRQGGEMTEFKVMIRPPEEIGNRIGPH
jgi:hypothetical protein